LIASAPSAVRPDAPDDAREALAAQDLFALGRQAAAARDARWNRRGFFSRRRTAGDAEQDDGIIRFSFRTGESDAERLARLAALATATPPPVAIMPAPEGEPHGLDTLRLFALCRLALPAVPHVIADVTRLGPRLAQMALGFGADELFAPIVGERALRLGDNAHNPALTRKEAAVLIRGAGLTACERLAGDTYEEVTA
jgi:hypothetical protein